MHRRKSFLFRLFALLFALLLLITASVELALYHYARQVVGQEYIRLNQAGLRQISYTLGQGMTDTQTPVSYTHLAVACYNGGRIGTGGAAL